MLIQTLVPKKTWNIHRSTSNLNIHQLLTFFFLFTAFYFIGIVSTQ